MYYQKIKPSPPLQPYVRCYYVLEHESGLGASFELESSPNPSYALVFNYGARYQLFNSYARIKRFNYVKHCLAKNPSLSWTAFIDQGGFYDHSHFIKEFAEFSGEKPSHFIRQRRALREQLIT